MKAKDAIMCTESTRCTATWIFVAWSYKVFFIAGVCRFIIIFPWKSSRSCPDVWKPEVKVKKNRKYQTHFQTLLDICEWKKGENFDLWLLFPLSRSLSTGDAVVTVRHYVRTGSGLDTEWTLQWTGLAQDKRTAQERKGGRTWADSPLMRGTQTPFSWSESAIFVRRVGQFRLRWAFIRDTKFCISQLDWRCLKKVRHYWEIHGFTVLLRVDTTIMSAAAWSVSLA